MHNVQKNLVWERCNQLTWKAIDITFTHEVLIQDFITVAIPYLSSFNSENDMF